ELLPPAAEHHEAERRDEDQLEPDVEVEDVRRDEESPHPRDHELEKRQKPLELLPPLESRDREHSPRPPDDRRQEEHHRAQSIRRPGDAKRRRPFPELRDDDSMLHHEREDPHGAREIRDGPDQGDGSLRQAPLTGEEDRDGREERDHHGKGQRRAHERVRSAHPPGLPAPAGCPGSVSRTRSRSYVSALRTRLYTRINAND